MKRRSHHAYGRTVLTERPRTLNIRRGLGSDVFHLDYLKPHETRRRTSYRFTLIRGGYSKVSTKGRLSVPRNPARTETLVIGVETPARGKMTRHTLEVVVGGHALMVPMGLHALCLDAPTVAAGPMADFTRLPHKGAHGEDIAPDTPYVGDEVAAQPFRNLNFTLQPGIHLHWILPGAHRRGGSQRVMFEHIITKHDLKALGKKTLPRSLRARFTQEGCALDDAFCVMPGNTATRWQLRRPGGDAVYRLRLIRRGSSRINHSRGSGHYTLHVYDPEARFPPVPNRWLVTRRRDGAEQQSWIVESNALRAPFAPDAQGAVTYPNDPRATGMPPFMRLGRTRTLEDWLARDPDAEIDERLPGLTALGYGEPTFAAFYPNCHGVFGFHDASVAGLGAEARVGLSYDVIGWHDDPTEDLLTGPDLRDRIEERAQKYGIDPARMHNRNTNWIKLSSDALADALGWQLGENDAKAPLPQRTIAYARIRFDAGDQSKEQTQSDVKVAIGNTGNEAVSAFFAEEIDKTEADILTIEEQLESLHLARRLDGAAQDLLFRFRAARHRNAFKSVKAGMRWIVTLPGAEATDAGEPRPAPEDAVPPQAMAPLDDLNRVQADLNRAIEARASARSTLFADWHKYLDRTVALSPPAEGVPDLDANAIRHFIEGNALPAVERLSDGIEALEMRRDAALDALARTLQDHAADTQSPLSIVPAAEARYWSPHDPVLVLSNIDLGCGLHDKPQTAVPCRTLSLEGEESQWWAAIRREIDAVEASGAGMLAGIHHAKLSPWRPFLLEWRAQMQRFEEADHQHEEAHSPTFLEANFENDPDGMDIILKAQAKGELSSRPHSIAGRSLLTADTESLLLERLDVLLGRRLAELKRETDRAKAKDDDLPSPESVQPDEPNRLEQLNKSALGPSIETAAISAEGREIIAYRSGRDARRMTHLTPVAAEHPTAGLDESTPPTAAHPDPADDPETLRPLLDWFAQAPDPAKSDQLATMLMELHTRLAAHGDKRLISVRLGGFHDLMLMRRRTMQLPVAIPHGFASEQRLAARVRDAVARAGTSAPAPAAPFNPLRAGRFTLSNLRLLDCFGRVRDLPFNPSTLRRPTAMADPDPDAQGAVRLRPRLAQPARLNFRWLAAAQDALAAGAGQTGREAETNSAAASTPLCGFLMHNHLDCTLEVFEADGAPLGVIDVNGVWRPPPGRAGVAFTDISNATLRRVVQYFLDNSGADMHRRIESHLRIAAPAGTPDDAAPAFMAGRPLAVARARIELDVRGDLAPHQGWAAFARAMAAPDAPRDTDGVAKMRVPVRLGDYGLRDDGLVAFWEETQTPDGRTKLLRAHFTEKERHLPLLPDGPARIVTLLFDPRGTIHAASGVLPVKRLTLPNVYFSAQIKRLETGFSVGPIISPAADPRMPLPRVPGTSWLWATAQDGARHIVGSPRAPEVAKDWGGQQMLSEGWLLLDREQPLEEDGNNGKE